MASAAAETALPDSATVTMMVEVLVVVVEMLPGGISIPVGGGQCARFLKSSTIRLQTLGCGKLFRCQTVGLLERNKHTQRHSLRRALHIMQQGAAALLQYASPRIHIA